MTGETPQRPLGGLRIVDLADGDADQVSRLLADFGADVVKVEPPGGCSARTRTPRVNGQGLRHALHNANKRSVVLDPSDGDDRRRFTELVGGADIVVDSGIPGGAAAFGASCEALSDEFERLVTLSVTDFGTKGPRASWRATDAVLVAMSSVLARSGAPDGPPVLPPDGIASATAAAQAAWAVLVAYYQRQRTGRGDFIDFSRFEAVLQSLDPPFGAQGQAAAARGLTTARRGRPKNQDSYPIFACADGSVRICILAPRQWRAMRSWLGEPAEFQDPKYDTISARAADFDRIRAFIAELFEPLAMDEIVAQGATRGVPVAAVLPPAAVRRTEHFQSVSAWTRAELSDGTTVTVPDGCVIVGGERAGVRWLGRPLGGSTPGWPERALGGTAGDRPARPLEGLTVLDLGVIVAGGELGRLFADMGADVIKIESPSYPDGLRQARPGQVMSESFAWTHRNQRAAGVDLRTEGGQRVFGRLVERADAVFANFKPGTLASLGFSFDDLQRLNERVVLTESSAFGDSGPWSRRLGYGPLVRASTGVTHLWATDDPVDPESRYPFSDAVTVYPDHVVARLSAIATLAAVMRRHVTGRGSHVRVSQAEAAVSQLDVLYTAEWARDAGADVVEDRTLHGVYPCRGDDEWCVVSIASDGEWCAVLQAIGSPRAVEDERFTSSGARWARRYEARSLISGFTRELDADEVAARLQGAGVAAARMLRGGDLLDDPQVQYRGLYSSMTHPLFDVDLPTETGPAPYRHIPPAALRPAPLLGEDTVEVCQGLLGMDAAEVDSMIADGVLFAAPAVREVNPA